MTSTFEQSKAWQRAGDLLALLEENFANSKKFWFRDQLLRAALSIMNNIAEGHGRASTADRNRFLVYSRASCNEVRSMVHHAKRMAYMDHGDIDKAFGLCHEVNRLIYAYMNPPTKRFGHLPGFALLLTAASWFEAAFQRIA